LWNYDILRFAAEAQLKFHPVDPPGYWWGIEALERYENRAPSLVRLIEVAAPGAPARWQTLSALPASPVPHPVTPQMVAQKRRQLVDDAPADDIMSRLNWLHMSMTLATDAEFIQAAGAAFESLRNVTTSTGAPFFPDLAAYFIQFDPAVRWRTALPRLMLRVEEEPAFLTTRPAQAPGQMIFAAATDLLNDLTMTRDAYLAPMFLCHSPFIWAIVGQRVQGVMVFSLGSPMRGRDVHAAELLQQFMPPGPPMFSACPPFTAAQITATLRWWTDQLDSLLSVITDPSTYVDKNGQYSPRRQLEAQLTFEQAGRRIQATLVHQRDQDSRRSMAFGALDTLGGGIALAFDEAVKLSRAQKTLDKLQATLPADVAAVLLPCARRAVEALRECQRGFIPSGWVSGGQVTVPDKSGTPRVLTVEEATAQYLRILRNAGHGFSGQSDKDRRRDEVLLISHTGEIQADFALLPYLYWLDVYRDPAALRRKLARR
jgi:hypothetical protein